MNKRLVYWAALIVVGLSALALNIWAAVLWMGQLPGGWDHFRGPHGFHPGGFGALGLGLLVLIGLALFVRSRNKTAPLDPLGDLAGEYVEGRIGRDEFFSRKAVLEEQS